MLSNQELSRFRSLLESQLADLKERLTESEAYGTGRAAMQEAIGELSNYDNHPADVGSEMFERGKDVALYEHREEEMRDIERALAAIEQGTYGICEICRAEIPQERLEALPTTLRCVQHAEEEFVSQRRPAEEDVLAPPFGEYAYDRKWQATFYDSEDTLQDVTRYGTSDTPSDFGEQAHFSYNDMYAESEEPVGYVEDVEGFLLADMEGRFIGVNTEDPLHEEYEAMLDEADVVSVLGNPDIMEDYSEKDSYVDEYRSGER
jgi:YteA family regulatory protein